MNRRDFLALSGSTLLWYLTNPIPASFPGAAPSSDRPTTWPPTSNPLDLVEWRYAAGRIVDGDQDFGFILSILNIDAAPILEAQQLLVERKNFVGGQEFVEKAYNGVRNYDVASRTYTFKDETDQQLASWQWDALNQVYRLTLTTPELTLTDLVLRPQGELIAEGGDGEIQAGRINGILIDSTYHADWVNIEMGGQTKGVARVDMQSLRRSNEPIIAPVEYGHHWFAVAADLADGTPVWISAWRIEDVNGPFWTVTIATGSATSWQIVTSLTEGNSAAPLEVEVLGWQFLPEVAVPSNGEPQGTGYKWRLTAPNNALDLEITVPPGQFSGNGSPLSGFGGPSFLQEALGVVVTGTALGQSITSVKLAVAESTAEFFLNFLPNVGKQK